MQPLVFLTLRCFVNGVKRSLTSGKRLVGLVGVSLYYFFMFMRPFAYRSNSFAPRGLVQMPPLQVIDSVVFWIFAFVTLILMAGGSQRSGFRPADVDVLFATPIEPRLVLLFKLARDYLIALILPLFFLLIGYGPISTLSTIIKDFPSEGGLVIRGGAFAWILVSLCWVCLQQAISLSVNRSDLDSDRIKRILSWGGAVLVILVTSSILYDISKIHGADGFVAASHHALYRFVFFTASCASLIVMGALQGNLGSAALGTAALLGAIAVALDYSMTMVPFMYDQAAAKGFSNTNRIALQGKGDVVAMSAEMARMGKLRAKSRRFHRLSIPGPPALLWKEVIVQSRSTAKLMWFLGPMMLLLAVTPALVESRVGVGSAAFGIMLLFMLGNSVLFSSMAMQGSFIELLRRVDLQKPLPFRASTIVFWEIVAKGIAPSVFAVAGAVLAVTLRFDLWPYGLAGAIAMPSLAVLMSAAIFLVAILFPDVNDPSQRAFGALMVLLALVIICVPGIACFSLVAWLSNPPFGAILWAATNLGLTAGVAFLGGGLYERFNPSE